MTHREVDCRAGPATFRTIGRGDVVWIAQSYEWQSSPEVTLSTGYLIACNNAFCTMEVHSYVQYIKCEDSTNAFVYQADL